MEHKDSLKEQLKENLKENLNATKQNLEAAKQNLEAAKQESLAAAKCDNIDDPIDIHVTEVVSMALSKVFIRLHIIPNVVTILSMLTGISGALLLLKQTLLFDLLGAALVLFSYVLDCCDGQIARTTKHFSKVGRLLDGLSDATVYFFLFAVTFVRLGRFNPFAAAWPWALLMAAALIVVFLIYIRQNQLPDYFKNLHMFLIDNSKGSELTRAKHIKAQREKEPRGSITRFGLTCYYPYTAAQEGRAPETQKLLDAIEVHGKNPELSAAFYETSRKLIRKTNLLTFHLRTYVLLLSIILHLEPVGLLFGLLVLEPIRVVLLRKYEQLSKRLLSLVK